jgi:hypothetical protein
MPTNMQHCIDECTNCHRICVETMQHCLKKGGRHAAADHIREMADCAQMCATSADFMLRGSDMHATTCGACAEACEHCARSCQQVNDDAAMQKCIDACQRCAASCREMAGA